MSNGHSCDNCERHLESEDYVSFGSWSYTCPHCGFSYRHGYATAKKQVDLFSGKEDEFDEEETPDT